MLEMDPEAYDTLVQLYKMHRPLAARIDGWLDRIEADPSAAVVRRRLIRPGRIWAITVADPSAERDFLILWDLDGNVPVVRYVGPDVLKTTGGSD